MSWGILMNDLFYWIMKIFFYSGGIVFIGIGVMLMWELIKGLTRPE
jgi:hypothetical protein